MKISKLKFEQLVFNSMALGGCGCLWIGNRMNICYYHAPKEMRKQIEALNTN